MSWLSALLRIFAGVKPRPKPKSSPYPIQGHDEEFRNTVTFYYRQELGREPDLEGLAHWVNSARYGMTGEQIRDALHNSPEGIAYRNRPPEPPPEPEQTLPEPKGDLTSQPRRGSSLYGLFGDREWDYKTFAHQLSDAGLNATGVWCWGGWIGPNGWNWDTGRFPFTRRSDGRWDVFAKNQQYFEDAEAVNAYFNSYGIRMTWTIADLYVWSNRKPWSGLSESPFRNNVNGLVWADDTVLTQPLLDPWLYKFCVDMAALLGDTADFITANEMPEKEFHYRIRDALRAGHSSVRVLVNRNSDSCGEYRNMRIKEGAFDGISFHGWRNLEFVHHEFYPEQSSGEPNTHYKLLHTPAWAEPKKIIACSDGARNGNPDPRNAYDWTDLKAAFAIAAEAGAGIDHQSAAKMALATYGTHDLNFVETDFLKMLAQL